MMPFGTRVLFVIVRKSVLFTSERAFCKQTKKLEEIPPPVSAGNLMRNCECACVNANSSLLPPLDAWEMEIRITFPFWHTWMTKMQRDGDDSLPQAPSKFSLPRSRFGVDIFTRTEHQSHTAGARKESRSSSHWLAWQVKDREGWRRERPI